MNSKRSLLRNEEYNLVFQEVVPYGSSTRNGNEILRKIKQKEENYKIRKEIENIQEVREQSLFLQEVIPVQQSRDFPRYPSNSLSNKPRNAIFSFQELKEVPTPNSQVVNRYSLQELREHFPNILELNQETDSGSMFNIPEIYQVNKLETKFIPSKDTFNRDRINPVYREKQDQKNIIESEATENSLFSDSFVDLNTQTVFTRAEFLSNRKALEDITLARNVRKRNRIKEKKDETKTSYGQFYTD